jgi:hypothetical protein
MPAAGKAETGLLVVDFKHGAMRLDICGVPRINGGTTGLTAGRKGAGLGGMFKNRLIIKGDSQDLNRIFASLNFAPDQGQILRHSDPSDVPLTKEQIASVFGGKPHFFGTTRIQIDTNQDKEQLKQFILKQCPKVSIT